jgi:hypothetical protein
MSCSHDKLNHYGKSKSVVCTELDDGGILLNLDTKYYYTLNETGLRIWQLIDECKTPAKITNSLANEYEIDIESAESSVLGLMQELEKNGLIHSRVSD